MKDTLTNKELITEMVDRNYVSVKNVNVKEPEEKEVSEAFNKAYLQSFNFETTDKLKYASYHEVRLDYQKQYLRSYQIKKLSAYDKNYKNLWTSFLKLFFKIKITFRNEQGPEELLVLVS